MNRIRYNLAFAAISFAMAPQCTRPPPLLKLH